jgi:hypothetical protein
MLQPDRIAMSSRDMVYYSYKAGFDKIVTTDRS